jgi:hypothetical protein
MLDGIQAELGAVGTVDVLIGVPSYNNARTIRTVLDAIRDGLAKHLGHVRAALINSDGGSTDETPNLIADLDWDIPRVLAQHDSTPAERLAPPYHGVPGRAAAQRGILEAARRLEVKACVLVGADCRSMTPDWIDGLTRPVLEARADYVTSLWERQRYDGTLTSGLLSPLLRALYGKRVRQPLGGPNGLSGRLVAHLCDEDVWTTEAVSQGIDLWTFATVATEHFAISEVWLGPNLVDPDGRPTDLTTIFAQVLGQAFAVMERTADQWIAIRGSEPVPVIGTPAALGTAPIELNVDGMIRAFRLGLKDLVPLWEQVLAPDTLTDVLALEPAGGERLRFPHDVWARVVYDWMLGYHFRTLYRDHLLRALVPLYLGRTAAFILETIREPPRELEAWIERGCLAFERQKPYLIERWH